MANLDTTSKRRSSVQIAAPWQLAPLLPDGAILQGDRQHIAWSYSGILAGVVSAAVLGPFCFEETVIYVHEGSQECVTHVGEGKDPAIACE